MTKALEYNSTLARVVDFDPSESKAFKRRLAQFRQQFAETRFCFSIDCTGDERGVTIIKGWDELVWNVAYHCFNYTPGACDLQDAVELLVDGEVEADWPEIDPFGWVADGKGQPYRFAHMFEDGRLMAYALAIKRHQEPIH